MQPELSIRRVLTEVQSRVCARGAGVDLKGVSSRFNVLMRNEGPALNISYVTLNIKSHLGVLLWLFASSSADISCKNMFHVEYVAEPDVMSMQQG